MANDPSSQRARVMVIDDDLSLGKTLRMLLAPEMEVVVETDGEAALARLLDGERYSAVLCDLNMPQLSGMALHTALVSRRPEAAHRVIFMTGGAFTPEAHDFLERTTNPIIEKPFTLAQLHAAMAALR